MQNKPEVKISENVPQQPGDGIRSLPTSNAFRIVNFELFVKNNKYVMFFGLFSFSACVYYLTKTKREYEYIRKGPMEREEERLKKVSKWDKK